MRAKAEKLVVIIISGRPLVITPQYGLADAWEAAWMPGAAVPVQVRAGRGGIGADRVVGVLKRQAAPPTAD